MAESDSLHGPKLQVSVVVGADAVVANVGEAVEQRESLSGAVVREPAAWFGSEHTSASYYHSISSGYSYSYVTTSKVAHDECMCTSDYPHCYSLDAHCYTNGTAWGVWSADVCPGTCTKDYSSWWAPAPSSSSVSTSSWYSSGADCEGTISEGFSYWYYADETESISLGSIESRISYAGGFTNSAPNALNGIFWMDQMGYSLTRASLQDFPKDKFSSLSTKATKGVSTLTDDRINAAAIVAFGDAVYDDGVIATWHPEWKCWGPLRGGRDQHWGYSDNQFGVEYAMHDQRHFVENYVCQVNDTEDFLFTTAMNPLSRTERESSWMLKRPWGFDRKTDVWPYTGHYPLIQIIDGFGWRTEHWWLFEQCAMTVKTPVNASWDCRYYNPKALGIRLPTLNG